MNYFLKCLRLYTQFSGRARRKEYWLFTLWGAIFLTIATVLDNVLGITFKIGDVSLGYGWFYALFALATLLPSFAVIVRRLHDIGKSGWWYFISCIPIVGFILYLIWACRDSQPGDNKYGPNPKA
jgi:uncharacterized membrane protein YhaH (DUF805 family)